jgi:predicted nucleic acid-binding protein
VKRVLVDTNVLLDVLAERTGFYRDSMRVWTLAETGRIEAHVAVISLSNCYYIIRKYGGRSNAMKSVRLLRSVFKPVELTASIIDKALDADLEDFEDAIQLFSAVHVQASCIISRNPGHFPRTPLPVLSPAGFLAGIGKA